MVQPPSDQLIPSGTLEQEIDLRPYLTSLARHWPVILATALVVVGATALYLFVIQPKTYAATAGVLIIPTRADLQFDPKFRTEDEFWRDPSARRTALVSLARSDAMTTLVLETFKTAPTGETRQVHELITAMNAESRGDLIELTTTGATPEVAALVANRWAEELTKHVNQLYRSQSQPVDGIEVQTQQTWQSVQQAQRALEQFMAENRLTSLFQATRFKEGQIQDSYASLARVERLLADAVALRERLRQSNLSSAANTQALAFLRFNAAHVASFPSLASPAQPQSATPVLQLQMSLDGASATTETRSQQVQEIDSILASLEARQRELQAQVGDPRLQQDLASLQQAHEAEMARQRTLVQQRDIAWDTYNTLSRKRAEVSVSSQLSGNEVRLASRAVAPAMPTASGRLSILALAGFGGLVLGVVLAVLLELRRRPA